ncbi:MAG: transposase, partial [Saprospiraceae bacterium]|nr:transposase [Saprospiraceae bacterium]
MNILACKALYSVADRRPRVYPWMNEPSDSKLEGDGYRQVGSRCIPPQAPCRLGLQIPPESPESEGVWDFRRVLPELLRSMVGVSVETMGFDRDHLHMVMLIPPRYSISSVMGQLKSQSTSLIRKA